VGIVNSNLSRDVAVGIVSSIPLGMWLFPFLRTHSIQWRSHRPITGKDRIVMLSECYYM
jgi:hypothetical protein